MRTRQISPYFDILDDAPGTSPATGLDQRLVVYLRGIALLRLPLTNKGTAFTDEERQALGLEGLLPPEVNTLKQQIDRVWVGYEVLETPLQKYQFLRALQERQETLFYALLARHLAEMLPIVYTPTVGLAVQQFNALYQTPRGLSLSPRNIGNAMEVARNYPMEDVRMIVVTDSSAILGIGDQGYGGLAIPIGKLALYTVGGGVSPYHQLPVSLDVGTDRADLLADPFYLGTRIKRLTGEAYLDFVDRFVAMVQERWPAAIIQWEDLAKDVAFEVLERHRHRVASFNDDIQGTGAVALAGVLSACRLIGERLVDQRVVVHGAGAGGIGVAMAMVEGMIAQGLSRAEAHARVFVLDSGGLLLEGRSANARWGYKQAFVQPRSAVEGWKFEGAAPSLLDVVRQAKASVMLGLSGQAGAFGEDVVRAMASGVERPIIFPLSNPTSSSEAAPNDLYTWTDGRALVATGSPFEPVLHRGRLHPIGQGNNAFIFPGLGLAAILGSVRAISDTMVMAASSALERYTASRHPDRLYPPVSELDEAAIQVATAVLRRSLDEGLGEIPERWVQAGALDDLEGHVRAHFWRPRYMRTVPGDVRPF
ncbi:MAG: NAD-dependent malic enzyme [Deltaproteobacteria bacterium]|nr:NAD-dependent malic enzyme [Deltaproteobacteria bacterium]